MKLYFWIGRQVFLYYSIYRFLYPIRAGFKNLKSGKYTMPAIPIFKGTGIINIE
jgi:hypothetical protein